jgi:RimJ/RimL family protein N-acetyltransferase
VAGLPDQLTAGPLDLHRWRPHHLHPLLDAVAVSFAELHRWMPWAGTMPTPAEQREVLRAGESSFDADREWSYVLIEKDSGQLVGAAGLHRRSGPRSVEIGYWVRSDRTGRGYATSAARVLAEAALAHLAEVDQIEIRMDPANRASAAIPPKLGFHLLDTAEGGDAAEGPTGGHLVWVLVRPA